MPEKLHLPRIAKHVPSVRNVNEILDQQLTVGQHAADIVARTVGSWRFIIIQSTLLVVWAVLNVTAWVKHWDPYPFILMNLVLSLQAAYTAPMIMMSQNRQAEHDRIEAHNDYQINIKAEQEIHTILEHLDVLDQILAEISELVRDSSTTDSTTEKP